MRCPRQSALINRAKNLMTVPFKRLPEWSDEDALINAETWLKPLNTLRVENDDEANVGVAPLPTQWVLDYVWNGDRSYGLESLCDEWNYHHHNGNATDEELEMMNKMLEDWHRNLTRWMIDWSEYEEEKAEDLAEGDDPVWFYADFAVSVKNE